MAQKDRFFTCWCTDGTQIFAQLAFGGVPVTTFERHVISPAETVFCIQKTFLCLSGACLGKSIRVLFERCDTVSQKSRLAVSAPLPSSGYSTPPPEFGPSFEHQFSAMTVRGWSPCRYLVRSTLVV